MVSRRLRKRRGDFPPFFSDRNWWKNEVCNFAFTYIGVPSVFVQIREFWWEEGTVGTRDCARDGERCAGCHLFTSPPPGGSRPKRMRKVCRCRSEVLCFTFVSRGWVLGYMIMRLISSTFKDERMDLMLVENKR